MTAGRRVLRALRDGQAARGTVVEASSAGSVRVSYTFQVGNQVFGGSISTLDAGAAQLKPGDVFDIVYLEDDPEVNSPYPPYLIS